MEGMCHHGVQFAGGEAVGLKVVGEEPDGVLPDEYVAAAADIGSGGVAYGVFVDQRVAGKDCVAELAPAVIDLEVEIGVGVLLERVLQFAEGQVFGVLIDIHFL